MASYVMHSAREVINAQGDFFSTRFGSNATLFEQQIVFHSEFVVSKDEFRTSLRDLAMPDPFVVGRNCFAVTLDVPYSPLREDKSWTFVYELNLINGGGCICAVDDDGQRRAVDMRTVPKETHEELRVKVTRFFEKAKVRI
jgi:hypothetical protein